MQGVSELIQTFPIPKLVKIRQHFDAESIPVSDIAPIISQQLAHIQSSHSIKPGMHIAITCGSRGIRYYSFMVQTIVHYINQLGAHPFIVAAMGSHGGATEAGQRQILTDYQITEETMGCPVLCQMDTVVIASSEQYKLPIHMDRRAAEADGILLFNRVKPHTSFTGPYESGLMKMMAIGLGKQRGADSIHGQNPAIMHELIADIGKTILKHRPIIGGIAVIENAYDEPWKIVGLRADEIAAKEPLLRDASYKKIAQLPFDRCDVLVVDKIGKNISGDGMDPNITGRFCTKYRRGGIQAEKVVVLDLTEQTHGNAQGIGLADVTTQRLFHKMRLEMTYPTGVTNTFLHLMKIPMIMDNDREAIQLALHSCPEADDRNNLKLIRIPDTAHIEELEISVGLLPSARANPNIEILSDPYDMKFLSNGNLF